MEAEGVAQLAKWLSSKHNGPGSDPQHSINVVVVARDHSRVRGRIRSPRSSSATHWVCSKAGLQETFKKEVGGPKKTSTFYFKWTYCWYLFCFEYWEKQLWKSRSAPQTSEEVHRWFQRKRCLCWMFSLLQMPNTQNVKQEPWVVSASISHYCGS